MDVSPPPPPPPPLKIKENIAVKPPIENRINGVTWRRSSLISEHICQPGDLTMLSRSLCTRTLNDV